MNIIGDYHVHTPFCPHGSNDKWENYIIKAIEAGLKEISFTEHAPLPRTFIDPVPDQDSSMSYSKLDQYFKVGQQLKVAYKNKIKVNIGFEVDYIEGYEKEITDFLNNYGEIIDDAILSVHMLKHNDEYFCLDFSDEEFGRLVKRFGSIEAVYRAYYQTVKLAVKSDLGQYKPTRIGHLSLVEKFKKTYPTSFNDHDSIDEILLLIKQKGYTLDLNTAGLYKPLCQSIYPNTQIVKKAIQLGIRLIPGSDSHESSTVARGFGHIKQLFI